MSVFRTVPKNTPNVDRQRYPVGRMVIMTVLLGVYRSNFSKTISRLSAARPNCAGSGRPRQRPVEREPEPEGARRSVGIPRTVPIRNRHVESRL